MDFELHKLAHKILEKNVPKDETFVDTKFQEEFCCFVGVVAIARSTRIKIGENGRM